MNELDVSVIIPTFRRPELLKEAILSALAQENVRVEVVVVDDSPEGSARSVIDAIADQRITYVKNDPPSGGKPALVRNAGWPKARGRFIHFLDDDDRVASGFYAAAVKALEANPDRGVVFGRIEPFGGDEQSMPHERAFFKSAARRAQLAAKVGGRLWMVANLLFADTVLVNSACILRRECVAALGGYDAQMPLNEDVEFYCRAIRRFGFVFLHQTVLHYRILPSSLMHGRASNDGIVETYRRMYAQYRATHGVFELFAMKIFSRTVLPLTRAYSSGLE
jgi:glycosyltransferase involved in cell wall biosynthesis